MKLKQIFYSFTIITVIFLSACQKDFTPSNILPGTQSTLPDSTYLDKIFLTTTSGSLTDTAFVQYYSYDANRRVISVYTPDGPATGPLSGYKTNFYYNGSDTFPQKIEEVFYSISTPNDTIISFFTYSAAGRRIKDSVLKYQHDQLSAGVPHNISIKRIVSYQYAPGKIYGKTLSLVLQDDGPFPMIGVVYAQSDTALTDANNNILSYKRWDDTLNMFTSSSVFTYDANPNPFKRNGVYRGLSIFPSGCETFIDMMAATNNRLHALEGDGNGSTCFDENFTNKYFYHPNGFPKHIIYTDAAGTNKITFVYRTL